MKIGKFLLSVASLLLFAGCGSTPEEQKDEAQARLTEEKTKTMQQYKKCISKSAGNETAMNDCERILKANDPSASSAPAPAPAAAPVPTPAPSPVSEAATAEP